MNIFLTLIVSNGLKNPFFHLYITLSCEFLQWSMKYILGLNFCDAKRKWDTEVISMASFYYEVWSLML